MAKPQPKIDTKVNIKTTVLNSQSPAARLGFLRMAARTNLHYNALRMRAIRNSLPSLKAPTLLVRSGGPQLFTEAESQYLQQRTPYAESHVLEDLGLLHEDHPDVAASLIVGFLHPLTTLPVDASITSN